MPHWLEKVITLLNADTDNLRELAKLAGGNPKTFYLGVKLDGLDLSGQDLTGIGFTSVKGAKIDESTILDSITYPQILDEEESSEGDPAVESEVFIDTAANESDSWYTDWLSKWSASGRNPELRDDLANSAEHWLQVNDPDTGNWTHIWDRIWLSERRGSTRRDRFFVLAVQHINRIERDHAKWFTIWRRLWKHESGSDDSPLTEFFDKTLTWLTTTEYTDEQWSEVWRKLAQASKLSSRHRQLIFKIGTDWIEGRDFNHASWPSVWRDLWDNAHSLNRPQLLTLGLSWLEKVDERHLGWTSTWRRVWDATHDDPATQEKLKQLAEGWLDRNSDSDAFAIVWSNLWQAAVNAQDIQRLEWLRPAALSWIRRVRPIRTWATVWRLLWDDNETFAHRESLLNDGKIWLRASTTRKAWPNVWERIWNATPPLSPTHTELKNIAYSWLQKHPTTTTAKTFKALLNLESENL